MRLDIIDLILDMRERITCFDQSKAEYVMMTRGLMNANCKFHEHLSTPEEIDNFLLKYSDVKNELILHLIGFTDLIEQLDAEIRKERRGDDYE